MVRFVPLMEMGDERAMLFAKWEGWEEWEGWGVERGVLLLELEG